MKVREAKIDICESHTVIYKQFETVRLPLTVSKIQIGYVAGKVVVFYKEPYFIEILPEC